jgi:hypothetical protein
LLADRLELAFVGLGGEEEVKKKQSVSMPSTNFDGMGQWREQEEDKTMDLAGSYPLRSPPAAQAHDCYAKNLAGFVLQRNLTEQDRGLIAGLSGSSLGLLEARGNDRDVAAVQFRQVRATLRRATP